MTPQELLDFWFDPVNRHCWFRSSPEFDQLIRERFESIWRAARNGRCDAWAESPQGALALVILLDQLPLNMYRGQPLSFATEERSRQVASGALRAGFDRALPAEQLAFLFIPFMHSETLSDQDRSVALFEQAGLAENLHWARHHREVIRRFGRFPHRNAILGRQSSEEEALWLNSEAGFKG